MIGDSLAQPEIAGRVGVMGGAAVERGFRRLQDVGRGREIGVTPAERDDVAQSRRQLQHLGTKPDVLMGNT